MGHSMYASGARACVRGEGCRHPPQEAFYNALVSLVPHEFIVRFLRDHLAVRVVFAPKAVLPGMGCNKDAPGPQGGHWLRGEVGSAVAAGHRIRSGTIEPSLETGCFGDLYINTA